MNSVPHALAGRESLDVDIYGMAGIPPSDLAAHNRQVEARHSASIKKDSDDKVDDGDDVECDSASLQQHSPAIVQEDEPIHQRDISISTASYCAAATTSAVTSDAHMHRYLDGRISIGPNVLLAISELDTSPEELRAAQYAKLHGSL